MTRSFGFFLLSVIFIVGIAIGTYYYANGTKYPEPVESNPKDSIQDIVIRQVQSNNDIVQNVVAIPEKVSPYAKLIIRKFFNSCQHTTTDIIDIPKELINLTEDDFRNKYKGWTVNVFSPSEIEIYKEFTSNCAEHYVIKEKDGYIAIYTAITPDYLELKEITTIDFEGLREEDKRNISNGINIYGNEDLSSFIEDFDS